MTDLYGQDLTRLVQDLMRRIEKLEAAATSGRGLKIGKASGPFNIPSASSPDSPDDGASLYFDGDGFRYVDSGGNDQPIAAFTKAASPTFPPSFDSPATVSGTVPASAYNALRADCATLQACLRNTNQRGAEAGVWDS